MQYFGLIMLVVVLMAGTYVVWNRPSATTPTSSDTTDPTTYSEAIDAAKAVVTKVEEQRGNQVEVYQGISVSDATTVLDLSGQQLTGSLKAEIRQVSALTTLDLSDNQFTGIPAEIGQLAQLRVLNLANNPVTGLPYELGNLQNLEVLDLRGTDYATQDLAVIKERLPNTVSILID